MADLKAKVPDIVNEKEYFGYAFVKEFEVDSKKFKQQGLDRKEQRKLLLKMYEWSKQMPEKFHNFRDQILFEILMLGDEMNFYDKDLFILYLKNPKQIHPNYNMAKKRKY